jgi:hypothetical protein
MDIYFGTHGKKSPEIEEQRRGKIIALQFRGKEIPKKVASNVHFDSFGAAATNKTALRLIGINFDMEKSCWRFTEL